MRKHKQTAQVQEQFTQKELELIALYLTKARLDIQSDTEGLIRFTSRVVALRNKLAQLIKPAPEPLVTPAAERPAQ